VFSKVGKSFGLLHLFPTLPPLLLDGFGSPICGRVRNFHRHGAIIPGVGRALIGLAVAKNGVAIYVVKGLHFKNCTHAKRFR